MEKREFNAINVTIPYKQEVIPYCDFVDERARRIGAVNTIVNEGGILKGYNTDYDGFAAILDVNGFSVQGMRALILGSGGTSRTVKAVLTDRGAAEICVVSRSPKEGEICYEEALLRRDTQVIVNTTPVGMYPHTDGQAMDLRSFACLSWVVDVIYNPLRTRFLQQAEELSVAGANGLLMLVAQARTAAGRFRGITIPEEQADVVYRELYRSKRNIVLIGMPVSGKTTLGKRLSIATRRHFVDVDAEIEREAGMRIPAIFEQYGEAEFRRREREMVRSLSMRNGLVISTGGGTILNQDNVRDLRLNGVLVFVDRPLPLLTVGANRPLAKSPEQVVALYEERYPLYCSCCDIRVVNDTDERTLLEKVERATEGALPPSLA